MVNTDLIFKENKFNCSPFGPPNSPGVYAICYWDFDFTFSETNLPAFRVIYIGASKDIRNRVCSSRHPYKRLFGVLPGRIFCCFYYEVDNYFELEKGLIIKYKPKGNKVYNAKKIY